MSAFKLLFKPKLVIMSLKKEGSLTLTPNGGFLLNEVDFCYKINYHLLTEGNGGKT